MKQVIIINGTGRSGKDSFMDFAKEIGKELGIEVNKFSGIDPVKKAAAILGYSEDKKTNESRTFLWEIKQAWIKFNDGPLHYLANEIEKIPDGIIFIQIREADEIRKFLKHFPETKTLFMTRNDAEELNTPVDGKDKFGDFQDYDIRVENDGTLEELKEKVETIIRDL